MKLIDTHCHIYAEEFDTDREAVIRAARKAGVERLLLPAIDSESHARLLDVCRANPAYCIPMMGLHPTSVNDNPRWREELTLVEQCLKNPPAGHFCAVGEIGLDFYWSDQFKSEQEEAFRRQIEWALEYNLPIVVHVRSAWPEVINLMRDYAGRGLRGVFHAFSGTVEEYRTLKKWGDFLFGIGGVVTFKKSPLSEVVEQMELSDILLETDCPYLTPAPHRGKRNEPAYVAYVCNKVAEIKGITPDLAAAATSENACRLFGLKPEMKTNEI